MPISRIEAIITFCFLFVFISVMVFFIIKILFTVQKKQKGFNDDLLTIKANYEKELYKAQLEIQEQTFQQISMEIHDNIGQILSVAKLGLTTLDLDNRAQSLSSIEESVDIITKSLDDLRHMSRTLNTHNVKSGGLKMSIEKQVAYLNRGANQNIELKIIGEPYQLSETKEVILFRIVQEAVGNILRHAKASAITVSLDYEKAFLKVGISDNGKGFNLHEKENTPGQINGLNNMKVRAKLIDADFQVTSNIGAGTNIYVTTPI